MASLLEDIKSYVSFAGEEAELLRALLPLATPALDGIAEHFYELILAHPSAHAAITGGEAQVSRLKKTLAEWMRSGLAGPYDEAFWNKRCRIGQVHVQIGLPQRYMFTAMNVIRLDFRRLVEREITDPDRARATNDALDKLFDLELAIMLHAYQEDSETRLRQRERLATIGQMAASIGHDMRNPLGVIQSSLYLLRKRVEDDRAVRHLNKIGDQVDNCNSIVTGLLEMARNRPPRRAAVDVEALLQSVRDVVMPHKPERITLSEEVSVQGPVLGDPDLLRQALVNLVLNAFQANPESSVVVRVADDGHDVVVSVSDDGPGFPKDLLATVFEPLVTTKTKGTGLGLALVQSIVERHGGTVVASNEDLGASVVIRIPRSEEA